MAERTGFRVQVWTGESDWVQLSSRHWSKLWLLHLKYRYGNFYNCPVKEKGISVTGEACCMLA